MSQTLVPCGLPKHFHQATRAWFSQQFTAPTQAQVQGWATISAGRHTLIAAPTGSGKTLAAFLSAIDDLVQEAAAGKLDNLTRVVYISPLKALGNDVERNLAEPLARIGAIAKQQGHDLTITTAVRILGGRLETSGPVTNGNIGQTLGCSQELVIAALEQLEAEGAVLRGADDAARPGEITWCDRRVLSRIHRLTRNKLRAEIEPVTEGCY